jgi:hypothetical protein
MLILQEQDRKIEETRIRLNALVAAKGFNMNDQEIILLSGELDRLIVDFEKTKEAI